MQQNNQILLKLNLNNKFLLDITIEVNQILKYFPKFSKNFFFFSRLHYFVNKNVKNFSKRIIITATIFPTRTLIANLIRLLCYLLNKLQLLYKISKKKLMHIIKFSLFEIYYIINSSLLFISLYLKPSI